MNRGGVYWLNVTDQKTRPAVVVSPDFLNDVRDRVLVAPCTSQRTDDVTQTEVLLDNKGLPRRTKVQCQDLGTFPRQYFSDHIRSLTPDELRSLDEALLIVTGLWE